MFIQTSKSVHTAPNGKAVGKRTDNQEIKTLTVWTCKMKEDMCS
jgi:hypothetical protein